MPRILIFGDSITHGAWDKKGGWADHLKSFCMEKSLNDSEFDYSVYNLGISGNTTKDILMRLENEINYRVQENKEIIIIFAIGLNDSQIGRIGISAELFKYNIKKLCDIAFEYSSKIIFVGLNLVNESETNPIPWDKNMFYTNERIKKYDNIIKSICQENNIHFINVFREFNKLNCKKLLEDGLHPNSEGHQKIFETVRDFLIEHFARVGL